MFKNIKSLFIVEEEENPKAKKGEQPAQAADIKQSQPAVKQPVGEPGKATQEFMEVLFKAMEQNNIQGFDYLEFKQSLASLKKMPMDEQTRYQSAFAMAQTMGATPDKLIQTAQHYLDILKTEEQKFEQAVTNQKTKLIGSKEQEILKAEEAVKAKAEQIKQLTQEIEAHQKQVDQLRREIADATVKVETTKSNFIASYNTLVAQISEDMQNMKQFLK